ncbi:MAG: hypothetical protein K2X90_03665 [Candidatus Babeliaceae bacterium]|nr:hypothetical protein [Candidatus Babeliaceae bacterium]
MQFIKYLKTRKQYLFLILFFLPLFCNKARQNLKKQDFTKFNLTFTTGYVFKHDDDFFKERFKNGIQNIITVDGCYYFLPAIGIGSKVSYWATKSHGTFLNNPAKLQEVPLTFYLRTIFYSWKNLQLYTSLGGGAIFLAEKNYQEAIKTSKGIGEFELGLNIFLGRYFDISGAFRYLFPRETFNNQKADIGGFDLRAGIGLSY